MPPQAITPNHHQLERQFVTLDNFMDPGDGSMDGWSWSLQGRVTNTETITQQIKYAFINRGLSYESEGTNRDVPVNFGTVAQRDAVAGVAGTTNYSLATAGLPGGTANLLTGTGNHASSDAPFGIQEWVHLQCGAAGWWDPPKLRFPGEQNRQHRHEDESGDRPLRCGHRAGRSARPIARSSDRRLLPRLRPELSGPLALQRMEARVQPVRRQRKSAQPLPSACKP